MDITLITLALAFFLTTAALVWGCERLGGQP